MKINGFETDKKVLIIAEIGNNHEGHFDIAQELVRQAARSGADAVKFQTFRTEHFIDPTNSARFTQLKSYELTGDQFRDLAELAKSLNLLFMSTPFDLGSVDLLESLVDAFKISSGDLPFFPLISHVLRTKKPVVLSTGASDIDLIKRTLGHMQKESKKQNWADRIALLHCVSSYPAPPDQINLRAIPLLAKRFPCQIGYSDHTLGIEAAIAAVGLGARIIEKHFTLDKNQSAFRDHQLSADPADMLELVRRIRTVECLLGNAEKETQPCEIGSVTALRRSIVAARNLTEGTVLRFKDLDWTRPAGGLAPGQENRLIGKRLKRAISVGHHFKVTDVI